MKHVPRGSSSACDQLSSFTAIVPEFKRVELNEPLFGFFEGAKDFNSMNGNESNQKIHSILPEVRIEAERRSNRKTLHDCETLGVCVRKSLVSVLADDFWPFPRLYLYRPNVSHKVKAFRRAATINRVPNLESETQLLERLFQLRERFFLQSRSGLGVFQAGFRRLADLVQLFFQLGRLSGEIS